MDLSICVCDELTMRDTVTTKDLLTGAGTLPGSFSERVDELIQALWPKLERAAKELKELCGPVLAMDHPPGWQMHDAPDITAQLDAIMGSDDALSERIDDAVYEWCLQVIEQAVREWAAGERIGLDEMVGG